MRDALLRLSLGQLREVAIAVGLQRDLPEPASERDICVLLMTWTDVRALEERERRAEAIAAAIAAVTGERTDPVAAWKAWCIEHHGHITVPGSETRAYEAIPVDQLFVHPRLASRQPGRFLGHHADDGGIDAVEIAPLDEVIAGMEAQIAAGGAVRGLMLIGPPGCGKTTLLRNTLLTALRDGAEALGMPAGLQPVFLRFSRLLATDGWSRPGGLARVVRHQCASDGHPQVAPWLLAHQQLLFLLDGLDEVRDDDSRKQIADWMSREVAHWGTSRFIATCRSAAWDRSTVTLGRRFWSYDVGELDDDAIRLFIDRWYAAVVRAESRGPTAQRTAAARARERRDDLVQRLFGTAWMRDAHRRRLASNPLLLGTICHVHKSNRQLPERRVDLYDQALKLMIHEWSDLSDRPCGLSDHDGRALLRPLAWAQQEAAAGADRLREFSRDEALAVFRAKLPDLQIAHTMTAEEALRRLSYDTGVLAETDIGRFQFAHLTFQEFLCALHAIRQQDAQGLADRLGDDRFTEPLLLALARGGITEAFFSAALARPDVLDHVGILGRCFEEALDRPPGPFVAVLARPSPGAAGVAAMRIAGGHQDVRAAAARLVDHPDEAVSDAARTLLGRRLRRVEIGVTHPAIVAARAAGPLAALGQAQAIGDVELIGAVASALAGHEDPAVRATAVIVLRGLQRAAPEAEPPRPVVPADLDLPLVWVPPGAFWMGATREVGARGYDPEALDFEGPVVNVRISRGFWLGTHPVTNALYARYVEATGATPARLVAERFADPRQPVTGVSWEQATAFCQWLAGRLGAEVALPTEAEWEWAARGPQQRRYPWGDAPPDPTRAVFGLDWAKDAPGRVGERPGGAGPFGGHDQAGNVWEWCRDVWAERHVGQAVDVWLDPCRQDDTLDGAPRVLRGGSWVSPSWHLRCAVRSRDHPWDRDWCVGFRVCVRPVRELDP